MDGQLTVYEHESVAFSRFLHNFLLPGPLCYAGAIDSFVTCNSSFEVECYKYQVLHPPTSIRGMVVDERGCTHPQLGNDRCHPTPPTVQCR